MTNLHVSRSAEGSELMMELFNRMPVESLKNVPEPIAKRIGDFMVANGYRFVFNRWYLQEDPKGVERSAPEPPALTMDRSEWLRRYRARLVERRPSLTSEELDELANIEAHEALSAEYPDNPEKAVDDEAEESPQSHTRSEIGSDGS